MSTENEREFTTVVIEGEVWADTTSSGRDAGEPDTAASSNDPGSADGNGVSSPETPDAPEDAAEADAPVAGSGDTMSAAEAESAAGEPTDVSAEADFDALRALTALLVGGAIEGTSQLASRLKEYQEEIRQQAAENAGQNEESEPIVEDELVRLRYALVGLIFDAQDTFRRNLSLWAKIADQSARATNRVTNPVTNSFLFRPARRRYDRLIRRGESSLARWVSDGRKEEPPSRELARKTYVEIVDEFIDQLAENPQLQSVITQQSLGVASEMRDEVRERTVTADNLVENLVRRILRRTPRAELPEPPPQVQRWAGLTLEEYRAETRNDEANNQ